MIFCFPKPGPPLPRPRPRRLLPGPRRHLRGRRPHRAAPLQGVQGAGGRWERLRIPNFLKNDFCNITGSPDCHRGAFDSARRLASEYPAGDDDGGDLRPVTPIRARFSGLPGALLSPSQDRGEPVSLVARSTRFSTCFLLKKKESRVTR